jgi:hypothetical protein
MSIFDNKINKSVAEAVMKVMQQEELKGNQHKIDANKNGKVDAHDFKLLRGKKNLKEDDTGYQDRYAVKNGKAVKHNPMRGEKDEPHHVWADSAEHAVRKHAAKTNAPMKEDVEHLTENFADAVARVKAANGGKLPSGKPLAPKPKVKKDNTGRDYFGHDSVRQQSGYRGPGQSVLQTGADAIAKGAKAVGKAVKSSGIGKSVAGGIKAVKSAVKKTFSREEVEFIFDNFMLEDIQYFMVSEEYEMLDESSREMFEYFFEEQSLNEGFPTVADAKKRMDAGKTSTGSVTKTKTGLVHKRDYKDEDESDDMQKKAKGYGARQNYKRSTRVNEQLSFTEMLELYNEHGLKVLAPIETEEMDIDGTTIQVIDGDKINGYVETTVEEVTNDEFTKEFEDQKASFEGKKKQPKVAVGKTTGVKEMPEEYEQINELSKGTLSGYIKKAQKVQIKDYQDTADTEGYGAHPERRKGLDRSEKIHRAVDKLASKKTNEEYELDERSLTSDEKSDMEKNVKGMKKKLSSFKDRYGDDAKSVMYATATKMAKEEVEEDEDTETMDELYNPVTVKKGVRRSVDSGGKVSYSGGVRVKGSGASSAGKVIGHDIDVQKRKESMFKQKHPVLSKIKSAGGAVSKAIDKVASIKIGNKNRAGG